MGLARFRADPSRVRIGISRDGHAWTATVSSRTGITAYGRSTSVDPKNAVRKALQAARDRGVDGVDLGMQWAYEHPQHPESGAPKA